MFLTLSGQIIMNQYNIFSYFRKSFAAFDFHFPQSIQNCSSFPVDSNKSIGTRLMIRAIL